MTAFSVGQTVRWSPELAEWYDTPGPASSGARRPRRRSRRVCASALPAAPVALVGRIATICPGPASCCQCAGHPWDCPGPWYMVDFPGAGEWSGQYAEHQLQAA